MNFYRFGDVFEITSAVQQVAAFIPARSTSAVKKCDIADEYFYVQISIRPVDPNFGTKKLGLKINQMGPNLALIALVACVVPSALGQTFQYSRGWTNGKRNGGGGSGLSPKETACELHRIKALLEGKPLTPILPKA
ncbi:unnamed protein product [Nesidiocoris tenuis]|uniref:Pro-corazonin n=1 Tax=Nesidiocoris tenuis TaxID=355587 RepID=A0A6H5HCA8_9HEMI|nr:unnamed protein product [Nesidiocoris tenuis]